MSVIRVQWFLTDGEYDLDYCQQVLQTYGHITAGPRSNGDTTEFFVNYSEDGGDSRDAVAKTRHALGEQSLWKRIQ